MLHHLRHLFRNPKHFCDCFRLTLRLKRPPALGGPQYKPGDEVWTLITPCSFGPQHPGFYGTAKVEGYLGVGEVLLCNLDNGRMLPEAALFRTAEELLHAHTSDAVNRLAAYAATPPVQRAAMSQEMVKYFTTDASAEIKLNQQLYDDAFARIFLHRVQHWRDVIPLITKQEPSHV